MGVWDQDEDDTCQDCGKSISHVHPWDEFNCWCDGETDFAMIASVSPEQGCRIADLEVGEKFVFNDKLYTKSNNYGWGLGVSNITDADGKYWHLHPTTIIIRLQ